MLDVWSTMAPSDSRIVGMESSSTVDLARSETNVERRLDATSANKAEHSQSSAPQRGNRLAGFIHQQIDVEKAHWPLLTYSFVSGFLACVSFSACSIWCGFQSGNTVQVAMALSRIVFEPDGPRAFRTNDFQALCSLSAFVLANQVSGRLMPGRRRARGQLLASTAAQIALTVASAITAYFCREPAFSLSRDTPSWHNAHGFATIGLLSASFGLQGTTADTLGTNYGATVVLTSTWCQLGHLKWPFAQSKPRDDRLLTILMFCLGAILSRILLSAIGSSGTIGIGAGIRVLAALQFAYCPPKECAATEGRASVYPSVKARQGASACDSMTTIV